MNFKPKFEKKNQKDSGTSEVKAYEPITNYMAKNLITFTFDTITLL